MAHTWITMHADPVDAHVNAEKPSLLKANLRSATFQKYLALQKLKKAVLVVIASKLTRDQVGSLGDIFRRIDQSGDGTMTLTELDDAISRGNFSKEIQAELSAMKEKLALSDSDTLNWKAFLAAAMDKNLVLREDKIKVAFDHFKHSDTDYLTLQDFQAIFEQDGQALEIFNCLDLDRDGLVSFQDFRKAMEESVDIEI
jgi:calcium-dependent protein kinase